MAAGRQWQACGAGRCGEDGMAWNCTTKGRVARRHRVLPRKWISLFTPKLRYKLGNVRLSDVSVLISVYVGYELR